MTDAQRRQRMSIRNFMFMWNREQLVKEQEYRTARKDLWAVRCIQELIDELETQIVA